MNDVFWSERAADGSLGGWQRGEPLPTPLADAAAAISGDAYFLLGGWNGRSTLRSVWRATIDPRGSIGRWEASAAILPDARKGGAAFVIGDRLFLAGGEDTSGRPTSTLWSIDLDDLDRGQWQIEEPLPEAMSQGVVFPLKNAVLLYGASAGEGRPLAFSGLPQAPFRWRRTETIPEALFRGAGWQTKNEVLLLGGLTTVARDTAYRGALSADGRVTSWAAGPSLPQPRFAGAVAEVDGDLYFTGGHDGTRFQSSVFRFRLGPAPAPAATPTLAPEATIAPPGVLGRLADLPFVEAVGLVAGVSLGLALLLMLRERFLPKLE